MHGLWFLQTRCMYEEKSNTSMFSVYILKGLVKNEVSYLVLGARIELPVSSPACPVLTVLIWTILGGCVCGNPKMRGRDGNLLHNTSSDSQVSLQRVRISVGFLPCHFIWILFIRSCLEIFWHALSVIKYTTGIVVLGLMWLLVIKLMWGFFWRKINKSDQMSTYSPDWGIGKRSVQQVWLFYAVDFTTQ